MWRASLLAIALGAAPGGADDTRPPAKKPAEQKKTEPRSNYRFTPPVRLEAAGKPIDTAVGHAAPLVTDFDGDGTSDLLVGQFGDGILWVYRNVGTDKAPRYAAGVKFKDGTKDGRVPTG